MSEEKKDQGRFAKLFDSALDKVGGPRRIASKIYKSGELEELRKVGIERGLVPWSILRYERVINPKEIPLPLHPFSYVTPETFELHLQFLSRECNPLPMAELLRLIVNKEEIPERAVALTFDNAHAGIYLNAFPLLLKYQVPATVCVPTAYVNVNTFLPDDRILLALLALKEMGLALPRFESFSDPFFDELEKISPKLEIVPKLIGRFLEEYSVLSEADRIIVLDSLSQRIGNTVVLPEYEDFLRWEDIERMKDAGIAFASMGHCYLGSTGVDSENFQKDVLLSVEQFVSQEIPLEKYFCFPRGIYSVEKLQDLSAVGYRAALSIGEFPHPDMQEQEPFVLGRIILGEDASNTIPLFACRLFRVKYENVDFAI